MKIIYCGGIMSGRIAEHIIQTSIIPPSQAGYKFHKLFAEGFALNSCEVKTISALPVSGRSNSRLLWFEIGEVQGGVKYFYLPFINLPVIRQLFLFIGTFIKVLKETKNRNVEKYVICDALNASVNLGAIIACKMTGTKIAAALTDLPSYLLQNSKSLLSKGLFRIYRLILKVAFNHFDSFILLTSQMKEVVNPQNKPFIVVEGLVEQNQSITVSQIEKAVPRVVLYSGGLCEEYGVICLIKAFMKLEDKNLQFSIYGSGNAVEKIKKLELADNRIKYFGVVKNSEVVEAQKKATILVNPRFSDAEYTKYSFPSKIMEYLASGTPIISTKLPGMPVEYYNYLYVFSEESAEGFYRTLKNTLAFSDEHLIKKGEEARIFVMKEKNNKIQSAKVLRGLFSNYLM